MKEQLYTIPVNDAFDKDCECPVCEMNRVLESNAIEFTLGPSYMEDDIRMETDKIGFCSEHVKLLYKNQNRLGLALMLLTHMNHSIKEMEKLQKNGIASKAGFFKKKDGISKIKVFADQLDSSCYICRRIHSTYKRYIVTIFYLYQTEESFRKKFTACKGFCMKHYSILYEEAQNQLKSSELEDFIKQLDQLFLENFKRVRDDLEWFTDKFDYRYADAPWKNSKDALQRSIQKVDSILPDQL